MLRSNSIMSRIVFLHVIAVVATAILMPLALYWLLTTDVENLHRRTTTEQVDALVRQLGTRPDGTLGLDLPPALRDLYSEAYGRYAYAVLDDAGQVLFSSRRDRVPVFAADDRSRPVEFLKIERGERVISGASIRRDVQGKTVWVQVAEDLSHRDVIIDDVVANFFQRVASITLPILLLLLAIDLLIFRRAVAPLLRASDQARHISPTRIDVRLPTQDIPAEIQPLVTAVNQALDRLERGFDRLRSFAADVAHELRTPLAVLRTRIETLPDRSAAQALQHDIEGMSRVVTQLLDAAELETFVIDPAETADLRQVCAEIAEFFAPLALRQEKTIALNGAESAVWVKGNAELLRRAVRNLVENALTHAPKGTTVDMVVRDTGSIDVLDQGEGIPAEERDLIFQRFWRKDRRRTGGAGLGLSIVKRIVEMHGGTVNVENRPAGGAAFRIQLGTPAAPPERVRR